MLLFMPLFVACSDDDKEIKINYDIDVIDGDWLQYNSGEATATEATFSIKGYTYNGIIYATQGNACTQADTQEGFFAFNHDTQYLRFSIMSEKTGNLKIRAFALQSASDCNISLLNVEFNTIEEYSRIVSKHEVEVGDVIDNSYVAKAGLSGAEFTSLNPSTASVDSEGNITALATGVTFVLAKAGDKQVAVKIDVKSKAWVYASYIGQTIDNVLNIFGSPDVEGSTSETTDAVLYLSPANDLNLSHIQFQYDKTTLEIVRILSIYIDKNNFDAEADYIAKNYIWNDNLGLYLDTDNLHTSKINISPFESEGSYYIHYGSTQYLLENGHY